MIPLDTVVTTTYTSGPDPVTHFNGFNTALVLGAAAPGYSSGQALDALERAAQEVLIPQGFDIDWSGISYQERKVGRAVGLGVCIRIAHGLSGAGRAIRELDRAARRDSRRAVRRLRRLVWRCGVWG